MKFCVFANFVVCFLSQSLFNFRSRWHCNEAWHYAIQLVDRLCNGCFKLKHLFFLCERTLTNLLVSFFLLSFVNADHLAVKRH